ncbi:MAG: hypothetical protein M3Z04_24410 [Chloroflexota bacterium]|nr:hypothetical protein [Chloroflexota bacterium]
MTDGATPLAAGVQPLTAGMRRMLYIAAGLVFIVGIQLFIGSEFTDRYFAWTVKPSLTAAFLGGAYWASFSLEWLAARQAAWARARVAVPAVLTFTTLTLIATLLHLDKFHLNSPNGETVLATWAWIAVYAGVPGAMSLLLLRQLRVPGGDPPRRLPIPRPVAVGLGVAGVALIVFGVALFVAPAATLGLWPWLLTPLTARAVGAWLIGLGLAVAHSGWEADWERVQPGMVGLAVFGALQLVNLLRYPAVVSWGSLSAWVYVAGVTAALALGGYGLWSARRA